jgi:hypothetical protein
MFVGKATTYPILCAPLQGRLLALPKNITLGCKDLQVINNLTCGAYLYVTKEKKVL